VANRALWLVDRDGNDIYLPPFLQSVIDQAAAKSPRARTIYTLAQQPSFYIRFAPGNPTSRFGGEGVHTFSQGRVLSTIYYDPAIESKAKAGNLTDRDVATIFHEIYHPLELFQYSVLWGIQDLNEIVKRMTKEGIARIQGSGRWETSAAQEVTNQVQSELRIYTPGQVDYWLVPMEALYSEPVLLEGIYINLNSAARHVR
jgi:hypothetical protein